MFLDILNDSNINSFWLKNPSLGVFPWLAVFESLEPLVWRYPEGSRTQGALGPLRVLLGISFILFQSCLVK